MPRHVTITVNQDGAELYELSVDTIPIRIGAHHSNDVVLDHEWVSREHALVTLSRGGLRYEDRSRNGSYVDGKRVQSVQLGESGVVSIPPYELGFELHVDEDDDERKTQIRTLPRPQSPAGAPPPPPRPAAAPIAQAPAATAPVPAPPSKPAAATVQKPALPPPPQSPPATPARRAATPAPALGETAPNRVVTSPALPPPLPPSKAPVPPLAAPASPASAPVAGPVARKEFLLVVSGPDELIGHTFELARPEVKVGRQAQLDVPINMNVVSREHAVLQQRARGVWLLKDLRSANGTFVDGVRITDTVLRTGDRFSIGQAITLQLSAADARDEMAQESDTDRGQDLSVYQALRIQCDKDETGAVLLVRLAGRVDVCSYAAMSERLRQAIDAGERLVLIDLSHVEFMDHAGLGILVQTLNRLKSLRGDLRLVGAREWMKETFTLSRLDTLFGNRLVDDERVALAELTASVRRR